MIPSRLFAAFAISLLSFTSLAQTIPGAPFTGLKAEMAISIEGKAKMTQEIIDTLFSFSELGFQEFESQRYLTELLIDNDFDIELGVSNIPSSWWASWGSGEPVIALGSDVDGIPRHHRCLESPTDSR